MSMRFTEHALQRLNERFPGRDQAWTLLREVERKLSKQASPKTASLAGSVGSYCISKTPITVVTQS
jgi:hypothetical protein